MACYERDPDLRSGVFSLSCPQHHNQHKPARLIAWISNNVAPSHDTPTHSRSESGDGTRSRSHRLKTNTTACPGHSFECSDTTPQPTKSPTGSTINCSTSSIQSQSAARRLKRQPRPSSSLTPSHGSRVSKPLDIPTSFNLAMRRRSILFAGAGRVGRWRRGAGCAARGPIDRTSGGATGGATLMIRPAFHHEVAGQCGW